ncbi:hypothetical protein HMPREF9137_0094 [Prevotella denticola F0289]|nr:hypothetical protein HMPREF9137_0094 [Prevotella denticola F0289]
MTADTGRVEGSHHYNMSPVWEQLAAGEEPYRRNLPGQGGLPFRKQCGTVCLKEITE